MQIIDWQEAIKLASGIGDDTGQVFEAFAALSAQHGSSASPCLIDYSYGEYLFHLGEVCWPSSAEGTGQQFVSSNGACLGLLLRNACEVQNRGRRLVGDARANRAPEALLYPGRWLGLFELLDKQYDVPAVSSPDWNITAGTVSLYSLVGHDTKDVEAKIGSIYGQTEQIKGKSLYQVLMPILATMTKGATDWRVRVMFVPRDTLEAFQAEIKSSSPSASALHAFVRLVDKAWPSVASLRQDPIDELTSLVRTAADGSPRKSSDQAAETEATGRLAAHIIGVANASSLLYTPSNGADETGPFNLIHEILGELDLSPIVLRPAYIGKGQSGFYRLVDIDPIYFRHRPGEVDFETRLASVVAHIHACMLWDDYKLRNHIRESKEAFQSVCYRIPPARNGRLRRPDVDEAYRKSHREGIALRHTFESHGDRLALLTNDAFFHGAFHRATMPARRATFFKAAMRVTRTGIS